MFQDTTILITGGTGSFGSTLLNTLLTLKPKQIRIFSRDETKQADLRRKITSPIVRFYIGDVRDRSSVDNVMRGVNYVFHAAALKQVPSCEFFPIEAVRTNVDGTENVLNSAISHNVKKVVAISTDKAAYPICAMGISKAMMEKLIIAKARTFFEDDIKTIICCIRFGNVVASRGSVVPIFAEQLRNNKPITITNPSMTRFMMTLEQAVKLILFAFEKGNAGDIFVQKSSATTVGDIASVMQEIYHSDTISQIIGLRHSEKMYETLITTEEMIKTEDMGNYYKISCDTRDLNYNHYNNTTTQQSTLTDYNSNNTTQMSRKELKKMLLFLDFIQNDTLKNSISSNRNTSLQ